MDEISACGFFDIILGLFIEAENGTTGKVVGAWLQEAIVSLQTGQSIIFAPGGLCVHSLQSEAEQPSPTATAVGMLGQGHLVVKSRRRLTVDGGHSLLAVTSPDMSTRLGRVTGGGQGSKKNTVTETKARSISVSTSKTVTSTSSTKQVINMKTKEHQRYGQLLEYVSGTGSTNVRLSTIVRHFKKKKPDIYGKDENHIKDAVETAVRLGILVQDNQRISINSTASYSH
ncbi:hypothetical protein EIP86_001965 [Pleurotus ostreatoroseus]|nr:hypothetical protein EIP86_001965 [Pleurotus ostreatoroseus]